MKIPRIYYRIIFIYFIILLLSGILLDSSLAFSGLFGHDFNIYFIAKQIHRHVFEFGLFLNILPILVLYYVGTHNIENRLTAYFFWIFQAGILLEIMGGVVDKVQPVLNLNLEWSGGFLLLFSMVLFFMVASGFYNTNTFISNITDQKVNENILYDKETGKKSLTLVETIYNPEKNYIWNYFILIPLTCFFILFAIKHMIESRFVYSSDNVISNIVQIAYHLYIYNYLIMMILSGIFCLTFLPVHVHARPVKPKTLLKFKLIIISLVEKMKKVFQTFVLLKHKNDAFITNQTTFKSNIIHSFNETTILNSDYQHHDVDSSVIHNEGILRICKLQWRLLTILFVITLFYRIQYVIYRENISLTDKMSIILIPLFYTVFLICFRFISRRFVLDHPFQGLMNFAFMFLTMFILAEIITCIPYFQNSFMFTDWMVSQRHLFLSGFFLPVFYIFLVKNHRIIQKIEAQSVKSEHPKNIHAFTLNVLTLLWWVFTLSLVISGWILGSIETGLWNKMDSFGYFEYPGWIPMVETLRPFRMVRFLFFSFFIILALVIYVYKRRTGQTRVSL